MSAITTPNQPAHSVNMDRPSPSLGALVAMENRKLRKRPMTWVIFALITVAVSSLMAVGYFGTRATDPNPGQTRDDQLSGFLLPNVIPNAFDIVVGFGGILMVVLAASAVGSEYGWGTVRVLVGSGVSRTRLLVTKLISLVEATVLLIVAGVVMMSLTGVLLAILGDHDLSFGWLDGDAVVDIALMFVRSVFVTLVSVALAFTLAVVTRSLAAGIALGIGFGIVEGILSSVLASLGSTGETISELLLTPNIGAITRLNEFGSPPFSEDAIDPWRATALLTFYIVVMLGIAFTVFRRRDIASAG